MGYGVRRAVGANRLSGRQSGEGLREQLPPRSLGWELLSRGVNGGLHGARAVAAEAASINDAGLPMRGASD